MSNPYGGQPAPGAVPADYPGKTLGIVGLILAIVAAPVGLIISIIAGKQSREAGFPNTMAKAGVIVGAIFTALWVLYIIAMIALVAFTAQSGM